MPPGRRRAQQFASDPPIPVRSRAFFTTWDPQPHVGGADDVHAQVFPLPARDASTPPQNITSVCEKHEQWLHQVHCEKAMFETQFLSHHVDR